MVWRGPIIAVDWGTTNRRAWRIAADGAVQAAFEDAGGILEIPEGGFPDEIAKLRETLGDLPMLLGGMIGSNRGWRAVPYVPCPANARALAAAIGWMDERTGIVPGVSQHGRHPLDVMRGEEVQIVGALARGAMPCDALVCLPGTHAKWAQVAAGRIVRFHTWMTGEIFALLRHHSILAPQLESEAQPGPGFAAGVVASADDDPLGQLFQIRAASALDSPLPDAPSFASGLLIGAEVRAATALMPGEVPFLIGRPDLCGLYAAAIAQVLGEGQPVAHAIDGSLAFRAGIRALIEELP